VDDVTGEELMGETKDCNVDQRRGCKEVKLLSFIRMPPDWRSPASSLKSMMVNSILSHSGPES
jgi:hypothetical protein